MRNPKWIVLAISMAVFCAHSWPRVAAAELPAYVWWEGEAAVAHTFPPSNSFKPITDQEKEKLSGGDWLQTDKGSGVTAKYEIQTPTAGDYNFWTRKFWKHGPFKWRWNGGEWTTCGRDCILADGISVRQDVGVNWVFLGIVKLPEGANVLEIEALKDATAIAFDCWLLIPGAFSPNGPLKPGGKYNRAPEGWFPFEPDKDAFDASALLDMRIFNDSEAGTQGRVVARGDDLVFEKSGKKVRFWGVTIGDEVLLSKPELDYLARRLAKTGVNLVRFHLAGMFNQPKPLMEAVHYFVAALKKQGIYSDFLWFCTAGGDLSGQFYFNPKYQEQYKGWARTLLGTVNPYTGIPLAKDPSVVSVELLDEDSLLWGTFKPYAGSLTEEPMHLLEGKFAEWLKVRYGSLEKAAAAWGPDKYPKGDDFAAGRVGFYPAYLLGSADWAVAQRNALRARDEVRFLTELMRDWYTETKKWLRSELGYEGLVIGSNWQTFDKRVLNPLDQYANMSMDITAENSYFAPPHKGVKSGYAVSKGDYYTDLSLLKNPEQAILMHIQCAGFPHFMTEGDWAMPNRFRAEEPFLEACYGSLQGMDGYCIFSIQPDWLAMVLKKWPIQTPSAIGQYPAASLIFRNGYVKEGPVAINEALALKDLYELKGARFSVDAASSDFNAQPHTTAEKGDSNPNSNPEGTLTSVDPLAFYVGRVIRTIGDNPGSSSTLPELDKHIDRNAKIVKSATGELTFDYGKGLVTLNAPCAQGATGFFQSSGPLTLGDVALNLQFEYGAAFVVSLDGKPLRESGKILLQVMSEEKNFGWETQPAKTAFSGKDEVDCLQITNIGGAPLCVRKFAGTVTITRADAAALKVTALDTNGCKSKDLPSGEGNTLKIELLNNCMYYVIQK